MYFDDRSLTLLVDFRLCWDCACRSGKVVSAPGQGVKRICGRNVLSNDAVNLLSAMLAALLTGALAWHWASWGVDNI